MIPEHFKQNTNLDIKVFGLPIQVNYTFYWPEFKEKDQADPLVSHIEYHSDFNIISETGYRSHFFHTELLKGAAYSSIEELVIGIAESLAIENGYKPPVPGHQMSLF